VKNLPEGVETLSGLSPFQIHLVAYSHVSQISPRICLRGLPERLQLVRRSFLPNQTLVRSGPGFCFATVNGRQTSGDRLYDFESHQVLFARLRHICDLSKFFPSYSSVPSSSRVRSDSWPRLCLKNKLP
jgi:hypothetical protein